MAIELTPEEQSKLAQKRTQEQALRQWEAQLADTLSSQKIAKKKIRNKSKIQKIQQQAKISASKMIKAIDKGFIF
jgi:hypothetical protein